MNAKRLDERSATVRGLILGGCQALAERARLTDRRARRIIRHYGEPYLDRRRLHVAKPRLARFYLHRFLRPDTDEEHHNHPWPVALAIVISGGYWEERLSDGLVVTRRWLGPWSLNLLRRSTYHRVARLADHEPVFTLMVVFGRNSDGWCFKHPRTGKVTPWREFRERQKRIPA